MGKVQVRGYKRAKPAPKPRVKGYAGGGLVQERIDSGTGPNWTNTMGYADPSAQYASAKDSMANELKGMRGPRLAAAMENRQGDLAALADLKSRADNFEKTGLAPWQQGQSAAPVSAPNAGSPSAISDLGLGSLLNYQDSGPVGVKAPEPPPEDPAYQMGFQQKQKPPLGTSSLLGMQQGGTIDYRKGGPVAGGPPGVDTVPVVPPQGGPPQAMLDNGEYVLPRPTVQAVGKPALDGLVVGTTGQAPVGYADGGGFFDRFRNRDQQIEQAVQGPPPVQPPQPPQVQPPPAPEKPRGMADIMREIRAKNPPTVPQGYAGGGNYSDPESLAAEYARQMGRQPASMPTSVAEGQRRAEAVAAMPAPAAPDQRQRLPDWDQRIRTGMAATPDTTGSSVAGGLGEGAAAKQDQNAQLMVQPFKSQGSPADYGQRMVQPRPEGSASTSLEDPRYQLGAATLAAAPIVAGVVDPAAAAREAEYVRQMGPQPAPAPAPAAATPRPPVTPSSPQAKAYLAGQQPPPAPTGTPGAGTAGPVSPPVEAPAPSTAAQAGSRIGPQAQAAQDAARAGYKSPGVLTKILKNPVTRVASKVAGVASLALDPRELGDATIGGALANMDDVALRQYVAEVPEAQRANALIHYTALRDQARKTQGLDPMLTREQQALVEGKNSVIPGAAAAPPGGTPAGAAPVAVPPAPVPTSEMRQVPKAMRGDVGKAVLSNQTPGQDVQTLGIGRQPTLPPGAPTASQLARSPLGLTPDAFNPTGGGFLGTVGGAPQGVSDADYAKMSLTEKSAAKVKSMEDATKAIRSSRNAQREAEGSPPVGGWKRYLAEQQQAGQGNELNQDLYKEAYKTKLDMALEQQKVGANLLKGAPKLVVDSIENYAKGSLTAQPESQQVDAARAFAFKWANLPGQQLATLAPLVGNKTMTRAQAEEWVKKNVGEASTLGGFGGLGQAAFDRAVADQIDKSAQQAEADVLYPKK